MSHADTITYIEGEGALFEPWTIANSPSKLGVAISDAQYNIGTPTSLLLLDTDCNAHRAKYNFLIDCLSKILAEERFQAEDGAWTEWYILLLHQPDGNR